MSGIRIYVPRDAAARSVGADETARAISAEAKRLSIDIEIIRNGSRGLLWLEPLVEVDSLRGRVAYGPVQPSDVGGLFAAGFARGEPHVLGQGLTEDIPYLKNQERLTFARVGLTDPRSIEDYMAHGGYQGLQTALAMEPAAIVAAVTASGLRGRGGAAFPAGIKWKTVLGASADQKYVVCNADEGDSGTYSDRMVMEGDPFVLIEGMTIAGLATGATHGFIYLRWEYPDAHIALKWLLLQPMSVTFSVRTSKAAASASNLKYAWVQARIFAAKRPRCSSRSKVSAARSASSRRCRRFRDCSASPRSSTM